jgi:FlaA1/EpsC-like NDP-sugar epimerase
MNENNKSSIKTYFIDLLSVILGFIVGVIVAGGRFELTDAGVCFLMLFILYNCVFFIVRYDREPFYEFDSLAALKLGFSIVLVFLVFSISARMIFHYFNTSVMLISFIACCFFSGASRVVIISGRKIFLRYVELGNSSEKVRKRIIIFGAGEAGRFLADTLAFDRDKGIRIVAFIDDNKELIGKKVKGYPVVGDRNYVREAVKLYNADEIIIAIPHVDNSSFREIVELCCQSGCKVRRFANMSDLNMSDLSKATITEINIEDLLGREPVKLDLDNVSEMLRNKVVMVTGGAGSIGSEICRQVLSFGVAHLVVFDISENGLFMLENSLAENYQGKFSTVVGDIKDKARLNEIMDMYAPQIIYHAAAFKHVPMMERNPIEAVSNNIFGTRTVVLAAIDHHVECFIMISTDKAVNPTNVMGATKRITELLLKYMSSLKTKTKFSIVRFGNVLGSNGSVIPLFTEQIKKGGPITVTDRDIKRYFMTIPEAVQLVLEASSISKGGELFLLDMGEMVRIYDLAVTMIRLSGLEPEKDIKIQIIGLRPGEKMYEELRMGTESMSKTSNDRIFVFRSDIDDIEKFRTDLDKLYRAYESRDTDQILRQIEALIPTYKRSNYLKNTIIGDHHDISDKEASS